MDQRLSVITLGVRDLGPARAFYEAMGWHSDAAPEDDVVFFQAPGMIVALWDRARLAEDSAVEDTGGWGGVTLAYNARGPAEVDAVIARRAPRGRRSDGNRERRSGAGTRASSSISTATPGKWPTIRDGTSTMSAE